jgi:hypothetical protein
LPRLKAKPVRTASGVRSFKRSLLFVLAAGLPDGLVSYQKYQIIFVYIGLYWAILELIMLVYSAVWNI